MHRHIPEQLIPPHFLPLFMPLNMANISIIIVTQITCHTVILAESLLAQFCIEMSLLLVQNRHSLIAMSKTHVQGHQVQEWVRLLVIQTNDFV
jgi:hypothetical protein